MGTDRLARQGLESGHLGEKRRPLSHPPDHIAVLPQLNQRLDALIHKRPHLLALPPIWPVLRGRVPLSADPLCYGRAPQRRGADIEPHPPADFATARVRHWLNRDPTRLAKRAGQEQHVHSWATTCPADLSRQAMGTGTASALVL